MPRLMGHNLVLTDELKKEIKDRIETTNALLSKIEYLSTCVLVLSIVTGALALGLIFLQFLI